MSRMRLMEAGAGASALVCLHCGAETESKPPYEVRYCFCRSARGNREAVRIERKTPRVRRAA